MALYQDYETKLLTENRIDIQNDGTKRDIELYDPDQTLQLPVEPLERIQDFLDDYNYLTGQTFKLRYYQVLALLFTECFFADQLSDGYDENSRQETQRMLAYWMATGSGKTHIMHLNILQYLHHFCKKDNTRLQIFLTTPLANLIKQHERELKPYVNKLNETYNNRIELTIDTTQGLLQKDDDYFHLPDEGEIRRLILVDEAHIGLTSQQSGKFRELRNRLNVRNSFLFEYSATFHNIAKELENEYESAIIYRYDYARFYGDGYGKDHFFKPIAADTVAAESDEEIKDNLDECLRVMAEKLQTFKSVRGEKRSWGRITRPGSHCTSSFPINVLIGSRKFAEGWNSYRLSVIGLINLGTAKGNLIIQIFGRGVRLRGKGGDGKRQYIDHQPDYRFPYQDVESNIRRLETLTVYSLKQSYLKQFLDEVHAGGVSLQHVFKIQVNPTLFRIDSSTSVDFEAYRHKLPIFKQSKTVGSGIKRVTFNGNEVHYTYFDSGTEKSGTINHWRPLTLDYRTDKGKNAPNIYEDLRENNQKYACYLNRAKLATVIYREAEKNQLQLYKKENYAPTITDFLSLIRDIRYRDQGQDPIAWTDRLNRHIVIDVARHLRNRINAHINRANYVYEPLERSDFIYEYTVTKEFPTQDELNTFLEQVENAESDALQENPHSQIKNRLQLPLPRGHRHIYLPLMRPQEEVEDEHRDVKVSPDRLNGGEKKFVENLTEYIKLNYQRNERYEFYLMRNVQKIGIYLESDAGSYYPDFVLWVLDTQQDITHILFIDPKGEREIIGGTKADYRSHPKVKLARKSEDETLVTLEKRLETKQGRKFCLNSFLLLRDSSELGKDEPIRWVAENMLAYNILRLDWHEKTEDGSTSHLFNNEKSYLDLMFEKTGIRQF